MLMTTPRLLILRLFNVTFGRIGPINRAFRKALVRGLIQSKKPGERYVASSRFFDPREL
ncbi:MAG: hypothetical protein OEZ32_03855 [Nitrospinota bacterium]|nr:hypothetical protein [Nitrospinota bacterium]